MNAWIDLLRRLAKRIACRSLSYQRQAKRGQSVALYWHNNWEDAQIVNDGNVMKQSKEGDSSNGKTLPRLPSAELIGGGRSSRAR